MSYKGQLHTGMPQSEGVSLGFDRAGGVNPVQRPQAVPAQLQPAFGPRVAQKGRSISGPAYGQWGHQMVALLPNVQAVEGNIQTPQSVGFGRWPGPPAGLPRLFYPNIAALAGARERGHRQDGYTYYLGVANTLSYIKQYTSIRTTQQKTNAGTAGKGIPGVFVPTSLANNYRGRGSA